MKIKEKKEAIRLRKEEGMSIGGIAERLGVAKSSVSLWVRDIVLTEEQKTILNEKNPVLNRYCGASETRQETFRARRREYQEEGRKLIHGLDNQKRDLLIAGCMLYWAEGSKKKNCVEFCNSDPHMMSIFILFLKQIFGVREDEIALSINCYTDDQDISEIEEYWLDALDLPKTCVRKHTLNYYSRYSFKKRKGKLPFGVCRISVCNTRFVQQIFGAIQEIAGFKENGNWLQ